MATLKPSNLTFKCFARFMFISMTPSLATADETKPCPETVQYTFERGDTLSEILWSLNISPLYGRHGTVAKMIAQQPGKFSSTQSGHVQAGTQMILNLTVCPDPSLWIIENGILRRRPKVEAGPMPASQEAEPKTTPPEAQENGATSTVNMAPTPEVKPAPTKILEPVQEIVPPQRELEGDMTDENLNRFLNQ